MNGSFLTEAVKILNEEAAAVTQVANLLGPSFEEAVKLVLELSPSGRVLVTGLGKAGIVGQKISATLASTGTSSFYLHPTEALHGDLGRFHKSDLALCSLTPVKLLKFSSDSATPYRWRSNVAITSSSENTLSKHADVVLTIGKLNEAGALGLAPTSSTTAMMALGDALALVVLNARGFTAEQFAFNHPAGNLGGAN